MCVTGYDWEYETRIVYGAYKCCMENNINLLVFSNLMRKPDLNMGKVLPDSMIQGELEIFNLINYSMLDGIIMAGDSLLEESVIYDLVDNARRYKIPIIDVNDPLHKNLCRHIALSDVNAMEFVVRHLVEDHHLTKINFIGGFMGNVQNDERQAAYERVLREHNIPVEPERIAYGNFWIRAKECTEKFIKDGLPEAIVCASDMMAFFCMDTLKDHGYRIPEDVVVTGFDAFADCWRYNPTLTSVRRAFFESGVKAVEMLLDIWDGKDVPNSVSMESVLVKNQSCGCVPVTEKKEVNDFFNQSYGDINKFKQFNSYLLEMNTSFASAKNSLELYTSMKFGAELFGLNRLYVCICSNVETNSHSFDNDETPMAATGISRNMVSMLQYGHDVPCGQEFRCADLLPESFLDGEKPVFFGFSPMYFKNRFLGYIAYEPTRIEGSGDLFSTWLMCVSNNAGSFYMNNELEFVVDELENLYIRDPLTGLYNRRGMKRLGYSLIEKTKKSNSWVTIMCADIDNLKPINDKYGHEAGDIAITTVAKAIEASVPKGSICTRTGGDEYCIIIPECGSGDAQKIADDVDGYLDGYNADSGLPYKVGCSCGFYSVHSERLISLDQMMKAADENMYKIKAAKKTNRTK